MRKAQFGQAFLAGLVIVVFAIIIDRMSATLATERKSYDGRVALAILGAAAVVAILAWAALPDPATFRFFDGAADTVDRALGRFTARNGASLGRDQKRRDVLRPVAASDRGLTRQFCPSPGVIRGPRP